MKESTKSALYIITIWMFLTTLILILTTSLVSASDMLVIGVTPLNSTNQAQPNTNYDYVFNFTSDIDCENVLLSENRLITTNAIGYYTIEINISNLVEYPNYLCEYRNSSLRKIHNISSFIINRAMINDINLNQNITPIQNNTSFLGSLTRMLKSIYATTIYESGIALENIYAKISSLSEYLTLSRATTDYYNKSIIENVNTTITNNLNSVGNFSRDARNLSDADIRAMGYLKTGNTTEDILLVTRDIHYNRTEQINWNNVTGYHWNTTSELWNVIDNNTFLKTYRNLSDSDIRNMGYLKTGNTSDEIWLVIDNNTFLKTYRNLSDSDIRNMGYLKTGNTTEEILLATRNVYANLTGANFTSDVRTDGKLDVGTTAQFNSNIWIKTSDTGMWFGTFLTYTRGIFRDLADNLLLRFGVLGDKYINMTNSGEVLINTNVNASTDITANKFTESGTSLANKYRQIIDDRNITDSDIRNMGYLKTGNTTEQILYATRNYYYNRTEQINWNNVTGYHWNTTSEIWNVIDNNTFLEIYRNLTKQDIENYGFKPQDQVVNTTSDVTYADVTVTEGLNVTDNITLIGTTNTVFWNNGTHTIWD